MTKKQKPCELCDGPSFFPLKQLLLEGVFYDVCRNCYTEYKSKDPGAGVYKIKWKATEKIKRSNMTAVILNEGEVLRYYILHDEIDTSGLNGVYINEEHSQKDLKSRLYSILFTRESGKRLKKPCTLEEFAEAIECGADVIECRLLW